jgi:hypothetical protein
VAELSVEQSKKVIPTPQEIAKILPAAGKDRASLTAERYLQLVDPNLRETMRLLEGFTDRRME